MSNDLPIVLLRGDFGVIARLRGPWTEPCTAFLKANNVVELELSTAWGWIGDDISFLSDLPELRRFFLHHDSLGDLSPVYDLQKLQSLILSQHAHTSEFRFTDFPDLRSLAFTWWKKADSFSACHGLTELSIRDCKVREFGIFTNLPRLQSLDIHNSPLANLNGIGTLKELCKVSLSYLTKLDTLNGIDQCSSLEEVELCACKHFRSVRALAALPKLRILILENCGTIDSLQPLSTMENLSSLDFVQSIIADGDIGCLLQCKSLVSLNFGNRRHYSHTKREWLQLRWPGRDWMIRE